MERDLRAVVIYAATIGGFVPKRAKPAERHAELAVIPAFLALGCAVLASAFSLSAACSQSPRGGPPCKACPAAPAALPAILRNGLVFVKVAINDGPDTWMDLDTGTSPSIVVSAYPRSSAWS